MMAIFKNTLQQRILDEINNKGLSKMDGYAAIGIKHNTFSSLGKQPVSAITASRISKFLSISVKEFRDLEKCANSELSQ